MTLAQKIYDHLQHLPIPIQQRVWTLVQHLEGKDLDDVDWSEYSMSQAMSGMEDEESPYELNDLKEVFG